MNLLASDEIANAIQARHILTRLPDAMVFERTDSQTKVATDMSEQDYAYAPISLDGSVIGYISIDDVNSDDHGPILPHIRNLESSVLISSDSPIGDLMAWLVDHPILFVVEGHEVVGLVTPSDMNKQPGRTYFYLLIAGLEMSMAQLIRERLSGKGEAIRLLSAGRQETIRQRLDTERRADVVADDVAAMDFTDLLKVIRKDEGLRDALGFPDRRDWIHEIENPTIDLRHCTMHSVRPLAQDSGPSLAHLVVLDRRLRTLLKAADGVLALSSSPYSGRSFGGL